MKIYLDTGNIEEIKEAASSGLLDGVTTNPSLIAKTKNSFSKELSSIISLLKKERDDFTLSAEVTNTTSVDAMVSQGRELAKIDSHILVKIPLTVEGLKAVKILSDEDIRCNVTLCFSTNQAMLAAKAGAWCVSPFIGRVDDEGYDGVELIKEIKRVYDNYGFETKILAASIRSTHHILEATKIGVDIATMPYSIFKKLYYNPLTDVGIEQFKSDWELYQKELRKKSGDEEK